jgi:hypothetical protein
METSIRHAGEFDQGAIAHQFDDAAMVFGDSGIDEAFALGQERSDGARFVCFQQVPISRPHQPPEWRLGDAPSALSAATQTS